MSTTKRVNTDDIAVDPNFNHRKGKITPSKIQSLAAAIQKKGLLQALIIRELSPGRGGAFGAEPDRVYIEQGFKYRLIAGHRRMAAIKYLQKKYGEPKSVDCNVHTAEEMSIEDELDINVIENFERVEISPYEEATVVSRYLNAGFNDKDISEKLKKSKAWVKARVQVTQTHPKIQEMIHEKKITLEDLKAIMKVEGSDAQMRLAAQIRDARGDGSSVKAVIASAQKSIKRDEKRARAPEEIFKMMDHVRTFFGANYTRLPRDIDCWDFFTPQGNCFALTMAGWAAGFITNGEFYDELEEHADLFSLKYQPPENLR